MAPSRRCLFSLVVLAVASCGDPGRRGGGGGTGGTGGPAGGNGGAQGGSGGAGGVPDAGADRSVSWDGGGRGCGEMTTPIPVDPKTPDVLIAFDHSGSMGKSFGTGTRLSVEQKIVRDLVMAYQDRIRFGYEEFPQNTAMTACPGGAPCCGALVAVPPAFMNFAAIDKAMNPCGGMGGSCSDSRINTPTPDALRLCREFYKGFSDGIKDRYVLLSTDGEPNCPSTPEACGASEAQITMLLGDGVKTIVLGVSEEVGASACLEKLAVAGGVPRTGGPPSYYPGKDPETLKKYLEEIISGIAKPSCTITLTSPPPDPSKVAVFFDGAQVPWDPGHADGWDYGDATHMTIVVYGSWCKSLEGFKVKNIDVRFGCPPCGGTVTCG